MELLSSELMPSEFKHSEIFKNYFKILQNHKNAENLKLMNFMFSRKNSEFMDFTYEGGDQYFNEYLQKRSHEDDMIQN